MAISARANGSFSNLRRLVQEEQLERNKNARKIVDDILCWGATMQELMIKQKV
jgi:hypothetical protein